ncbi:regulatory factor X 4 [Mytilus galloprovincialis]|uniref:DNA-binding protein RFX6 n=1 Tax=Mytilus galloprovincialis TaxID=29158 RepID=A0A8B6HAM3_MYTGA|nr:regulatory factor X 4 [Mytilus galloprovincialis]
MDDFAPSSDTTDWFDRCIDGGRKRPDLSENIGTRFCEDDDESKSATYTKLRSASKPHSTPLTLKWLEENYEIAEGVCIPRSTLYYHYLDYCEANDTQPVNAASFGKIIRQQFPQITTRRLGTRGQSKYHYYGIGVCESSKYYDVIYSAKGVQNSSEGKKENSKQIVAYSPRSKLGTLLPEFPDIKDIKLPPNIQEDKVITFMMMYRTHCQRILDTVIRANFDEVQSFLLHFWQGMPQHIIPILDSQTIVLLVGVCDSILYKAIANVLMPTVLQPLPESLTQVIRRFAKQLDEWLIIALDALPGGLQKIKFDLARRFAQVLRRQTSLNHLCQASRTVVHSSEITSQMLDDWLNVDRNSIIKQTLYTMDNYSENDHQIIVQLCSEFEKLLEDQAPLESYVEWLDSMVDRCVVKPSMKKCGTLRRIARQFLLMWSCFGTRIIRDMTLHSSPSFGSFHLMHLMFDDYVLYLVESLHSQERGNEFLRIVKGDEKDASKEDIVLPDSSVIKDSFTSTRSAFSPTASSKQSQLERNSVITNTRNIIGLSPIYTTDTILQDKTLNISRGISSSAGDTSTRPSHDAYNLSELHSTSSMPSHLGTVCAIVPQASSQPDNSCFNVGSRPQQVPTSIYHPCSSSFPTNIVTSDMNRLPGPMCDWPTQVYPGNQQEFTAITRQQDQNFYGQFATVRPQGFDCGSYGYYDCSTSTRGFIPVAGDITFPCISDKVDHMNNNGKRRAEQTHDKQYKRSRTESFPLQPQMDDGFV